VLRSWSASLGGVDGATQTLAYRPLSSAPCSACAGPLAANFLRVHARGVPLACHEELTWSSRAHTPGAKEVAAVTGVPSTELTKAEISVLKLLDWQGPLETLSMIRSRRQLSGHRRGVKHWERLH